MPPSIAVVGAGLSGLRAARLLSDSGLDVTVFDKGRGIGGRSSSRRTEMGSFDHGLSLFQLLGPDSERDAARWKGAGILVPWSPSIRVDPGAEAWPFDPEAPIAVAAPAANALAKHLAEGLKIIVGTRITELRPDDHGWTLKSEAGADFGPFSKIILTVPADQAAPLLSDHAPDLALRAEGSTLVPRWTMMVSCNSDPGEVPDVILPGAGPLAMIIAEHRKPGRSSQPRFTAHTKTDWTVAHLEDTADVVGEKLLPALAEDIGVSVFDLRIASIHRWRFALPAPGGNADIRPLRSSHQGETLFVAGDWVGGSGADAALATGRSVASAILSE